MIRPGLERILRLLKPEPLPWKSIHVAGTNGKGSICAYISAMLHAANLGPIGRFTSPHIIDRWDCITVNEQTISESIFRRVEDQVKQRNDSLSINASEFELLTATAFEIFTREKVRVGVVECGMGGRLDATNVLQNPLVTVISRIGLDHHAFLGNTLEQIAREKAGIMKQGSPCVADAQDEESTLRALREVAASQNIPLEVVHLFPRGNRFNTSLLSSDSKISFTNPDSLGVLLGKDLEANKIQRRNMCCAFRAVSKAMPALGREEISARRLAPVMKGAGLPGRFQTIDLEPITGISGDRALLDGAHNNQAIRDLSGFLWPQLRPKETLQSARQYITWVVAVSHGKMSPDLFRSIFYKDNIIAVEFGPVDGMPWARPIPSSEITDVMNKLKPRTGHVISFGSDIRAALRKATEIAKGAPIVITGSLYLVSDVLRMLRDAGGEASMPKSDPHAVVGQLVFEGTDVSSLKTDSRSENNNVGITHVSAPSTKQDCVPPILQDAGGQTDVANSDLSTLPEQVAATKTTTLSMKDPSRSNNDGVNAEHGSVKSAMQDFLRKRIHIPAPGKPTVRKHYFNEQNTIERRFKPNA